MTRRTRRTQRVFREELPHLLAERRLSQRELARQIGVNASYLTFIRQGKRRPSKGLLEGAAQALGLSPEYFREYRELVIAERINDDAELLDQIYAIVTRGQRATH
jgi:transcriptional regulator with XRE-family HTH domain